MKTGWEASRGVREGCGSDRDRERKEKEIEILR